MNNLPNDLAATFRRLIRATGPISLAHYMAESNARYYASRDPLGQAGDFVTAPEVSQMFGELLGLWLADMWQRAGSPTPVHYVELGPGRGTLARDALRAMGQAGLTPQVHLVEGSVQLREIQRLAVPGAIHHDDLASLPEEGGLLLVANEFLDALPVRQLVRIEAGWREVMVALDEEDALVEWVGGKPMQAAIPAARRDDPLFSVIETSPASATVVGEIAGRLARQGGAALLIDYGYCGGRSGSTLQAVRNHQKCGLFDAPGDMDLSAHVDFAAMEPVASAHGARVLGTVEQGAFLQVLGIELRCQALARKAPDQAAALLAARDRLTAPDEMGSLFKVLGLAAPLWPDGEGFAKA